MVSNGPHAEAFRSNVCLSTCWRDRRLRNLKIVVAGRRGACRRYVVRFSHCSRRRCTRHQETQVTRGTTTPSTSITPCINAAVLIKRFVVLAKRESKGVGVRHVSLGLLQGIRFANRFFFFHTCMLRRRLPIVLSVNVRFALEEFLG